MPRKCANCEQIDINKGLDFDRRGPIRSDALTDVPLGVAQRLTSVSSLSERSPVTEIGGSRTWETQGPATVVGVVLVVGVVPEPGLTLSSGVRFWSNGRMIVLLFGEFTSCFSAWM